MESLMSESAELIKWAVEVVPRPVAAFLLGATLLCICLLTVNRVLRVLDASRDTWKSAARSLGKLAASWKRKIPRWVWGSKRRKPRPVVDALSLGGEAVVAWNMAIYCFATAAVVILALVVKRPAALGLIAICIAGALAFFAAAFIYRNLGARKARQLSLLFRRKRNSRVLLAKMYAAVVTQFVVFVGIAYLTASVG